MGSYCYHYDGTFAGFLCCVRDIYRYQEPPSLFLPLGEERPSLYDERYVETDEHLAQRVYRRLGQRLGPRGLLMVAQGFLTILDHKERRLWELIDLGLRMGPGVEKHLEDQQVLQVGKAIRHLQRECELLTGFTRFSDYDGLLVGEIAPKNWVLPVLRVHFCDRLAQEPFLLFDKTHGQLLIHQPGPEARGRGRWSIVDAQDFTVPPPSQAERAYRELWRRFYDTLAIESRYNPKCRQTHMPKRYWDCMTEFQSEAPTPPPGGAPPTLEGAGAASPRRRTPLSPGSA